jgi:HTH-type transcriptional regulator / antitoxin HigA
LNVAVQLKPIRIKRDYEAALAEVGRLWCAESGTPKGNRLDVIEMHKAKRYPLDSPNPIEAIGFPMEQ